MPDRARLIAAARESPFTRALTRFDADDGAALAGHMAFSAMLALFPFVIFVVALGGLLIGKAETDTAIQFAFEFLPPDVASVITPAIEEVLGTRAKGGILTVSLLGAIYVASNGVESVRVSLNRAYNISEKRSFAPRRAVCVAFVFAGAALFVVLAALIVLGPVLLRLALAFLPDVLGARLLESKPVIHAVRYSIGALALIAALYSTHRWLPHRPPRMHMLPGVLLTAVLWLMLASLFSVYLAFAPSYATTYGTLGGVIVTLLFFYFSAMIFIYGAEFNAALAGMPLQPEAIQRLVTQAPVEEGGEAPGVDLTAKLRDPEVRSAVHERQALEERT